MTIHIPASTRDAARDSLAPAKAPYAEAPYSAAALADMAAELRARNLAKRFGRGAARAFVRRHVENVATDAEIHQAFVAASQAELDQ